MPWLVKNNDDPKDNLLFVHVPRCGGTSLTKLFKVDEKSRQGRDCYHKLGMYYFFYRYKLLERSNFPMLTIENLIVAVQVAVAVVIWYFGLVPSLREGCEMSQEVCPPGVVTISLWSSASLMFLSSTFLFTAPISGRMDWIRRLYSIFVGKILCNWTGAEAWLTGVSFKGYIVHFTAQKMCKYGFVSREEFKTTNNFAIVRNPFSRMVSIYMYNRLGPLESFDHFVESWYKKFKAYEKKNSTEEWDVYCHVLPQFEYTHTNHGTEQIVSCVIKQEELKDITADKRNQCQTPTGSEKIPGPILDALKSMPHSNRRKSKNTWQDRYSERTMQLVVEMYEKDFDIFGYEKTIKGRDDLNSKKKEPELLPQDSS
eukprot:CAMPEP_0203789040 /NCGR_PEP_ID=MMETSP0100_2-20121128/3193_1 /ASSEMBLY_ACC=CAM_ASM_000210 /TAXON_ID=96639 /ORGANISM=" , Strain NY0313808BC1" /LENGTH=369 /DNA_ID=CAMNT_0050691873 /DNA_START=38 /DNA_END=1144 /DNA_ORIENTATION=-